MDKMIGWFSVQHSTVAWPLLIIAVHSSFCVNIHYTRQAWVWIGRNFSFCKHRVITGPDIDVWSLYKVYSPIQINSYFHLTNFLSLVRADSPKLYSLDFSFQLTVCLHSAVYLYTTNANKGGLATSDMNKTRSILGFLILLKSISIKLLFSQRYGINISCAILVSKKEK